jgi:xanthine dehydrogenase accessory factor
MRAYPTHHSLRDLLDDWRRQPRPVVVALVLATQGSSYRKPGALALIDVDGLAVGSISGGCLEADLVASALPLLGGGECVLRAFDTRGDDDRWFGSQSGCRGEVAVLLWASAGDQHPLLQALVEADAAHAVTWLDLRDPAESDQAQERRRGRGALQARDGSGEGHAPAWPLLPSIVSPTTSESGDYLRIAPPPRLLLLGAGPEAPALIASLRTLGWRIEVIEHRARYLSGNRLEHADRVIEARPSAVLSDGFVLERFDAALCATHLFDEDRHCLAVLADSTLPLVGLLGPPARRDELLAELAPERVAKLQGRLEGPFGLMLGAHGPAAVALSIAARLAQRFGHV